MFKFLKLKKENAELKATNALLRNQIAELLAMGIQISTEQYRLNHMIESLNGSVNLDDKVVH